MTKEKPFDPQIKRLRAQLETLKKKQARMLRWAARLSRIRRADPENGTLRELARRSGQDEASLNRWIHGARAPEEFTMERIDRALDAWEAEVLPVHNSEEKPREKPEDEIVHETIRL